MLLIIALSTFVCISLVMMGAYWLLVRPQSAATERLKKLGDRNVDPAMVSLSMGSDRPGADLAGRIATPLNRLVPPSAAEVRKLQKQLMQAGFRSPAAPFIFRALHLCSMVACPVVVALVCAALSRPPTSAMMWILG